MASETGRRKALLSAAAGIAIVGAVGVAFSPSLLTYSPLLLVLLSPLPRHLVLVAPLVPIGPLVAVTVVSRMLASVIAYAVGEAYGQSGLTWARARYPRLSRLLALLERLFARAAPVVLLIAPGPLMSALAGAARMPRWLFVTTMLIAQTVHAVVTYWIGSALVEWTLPIVAFIERNVLEATVVCVLAVVAYRATQLIRRRARAHDAAFVPALPEEPGNQGDEA